MLDHPPMPESHDARRMTRSLRDAFGLRGPLLGGPGLLARAMWPVPLALLVLLPFEVFSWWASCRVGVCRNPNQAGELLSTAPVTVWPEVWTRLLRIGIVLPAELTVITLTVLALAGVCTRQRTGLRASLRIARDSTPRLAVLGLLFFLAPAVLIAVPAVLLEAPYSAVLSGTATWPDILLILILLLTLLLGAVCGFLTLIFGYLAVIPVLLRRTRAMPAIRSVAGLALVRLFPTLGTALLAQMAPELIGQVSTAVATADSWLPTALKQSLTGAVSLPLATSLYFVRFLDLRRRRDGYDREQLADDLRKR